MMETKINLKMLSKLANNKNVPLLGDPTKLQFDFMRDYLEDYVLFDEDLGETRGFLNPLFQEGTDDEILEHFRRRAAFTIKKHKIEIEKLWEFTLAKYDPIYNVEEHVTDITTYDLTDANSDVYGASKTTMVNGEKTDTHTIGASKSTQINGGKSDTQTIGAQIENMDYGASSNTEEKEVSAFNSSAYEKDNKVVNTVNAHSDVNTIEERTNTNVYGSSTDTTTTDEKTDRNVYGSNTDTTTIDEKTDTHTNKKTGTETKKYDRFGNVGIQSSSELLMKAMESNYVFDFYNHLYDIILTDLCVYCDEGFEVF